MALRCVRSAFPRISQFFHFCHCHPFPDHPFFHRFAYRKCLGHSIMPATNRGPWFSSGVLFRIIFNFLPFLPFLPLFQFCVNLLPFQMPKNNSSQKSSHPRLVLGINFHLPTGAFNPPVGPVWTSQLPLRHGRGGLHNVFIRQSASPLLLVAALRGAELHHLAGHMSAVPDMTCVLSNSAPTLPTQSPLPLRCRRGAIEPWMC